jgi:hypothetical protein
MFRPTANRLKKTKKAIAQTMVFFLFRWISHVVRFYVNPIIYKINFFQLQTFPCHISQYAIYRSDPIKDFLCTTFFI